MRVELNIQKQNICIFVITADVEGTFLDEKNLLEHKNRYHTTSQNNVKLVFNAISKTVVLDIT